MNSKTAMLPAVVIGGPPHSGKSVLAYSLSRALRLRAAPHYILRAYPDGEGDWANEAHPELVRAIRVKGSGTPEWIERITRDIAARPLPLIVDPGGKPTLWQQAILRECTHGILLCPDDAARQEWRARFHTYDLVLLADLKSELRGANQLDSAQGPLRGTLAGLERGRTAAGPCFEQLVEWLARLFEYSGAELRALHLQQAPAELVIELDRLGVILEALDENKKWMAAALPRVLEYLPSQQPLAVYERGPNWLYAALALHANPALFFQFDSRLGWVKPPPLRGELDGASDLFHITSRQTEQYHSLTFASKNPYLDYSEIEQAQAPRIPASAGLILDGKLPLWMWTALARAYAHVAWLGIYQPQRASAIVVHSRTTNVQPGHEIPYAPDAPAAR